jgi:hypothetical protein
MKAVRIISLFLVTSSLATSCYWYGSRTVVGSGDVESMEVSVEAFSGVSVTGACDVNIQIGENQEVWLQAQPQILDVMTYRVSSGILHIGFKPDVSVNTKKDITADIVIPALDYISVTGAGDFHLSGPSQPLLDIDITGTGNVNAYGMEVEDCTVRISGAGNCELHVSNTLDVQISGVGTVFYKGNPELNTEVSGVGNIIDSNI